MSGGVHYDWYSWGSNETRTQGRTIAPCEAKTTVSPQISLCHTHCIISTDTPWASRGLGSHSEWSVDSRAPVEYCRLAAAADPRLETRVRGSQSGRDDHAGIRAISIIGLGAAAPQTRQDFFRRGCEKEGLGWLAFLAACR